jgi:hypothetical protein
MISKYERGSRSVIRHCAERKKITTIIPITQSNRAASTVTPNTRSREREMAEASRIPNRMNGIVTGSGFAGAASPIGGLSPMGWGQIEQRREAVDDNRCNKLELIPTQLGLQFPPRAAENSHFWGYYDSE